VEVGHHLSGHHRERNLAVPHLVMDVCSRKVVAWNVDKREDPASAADLVGRGCLKEKISKGRKQPLVLHSVNGMPCVPPVGKPAAGTGRSAGHECQTTTRTQNACSGR